MKTKKQKAFLNEMADLLDKYNYRIKVIAETVDPYEPVFSKMEIRNRRGEVFSTFFNIISPTSLRERAEE